MSCAWQRVLVVARSRKWGSGTNPHRWEASGKQSPGPIVPAGDGCKHRAGKVGYLVVLHQLYVLVILPVTGEGASSERLHGISAPRAGPIPEQRAVAARVL